MNPTEQTNQQQAAEALPDSPTQPEWPEAPQQEQQHLSPPPSLPIPGSSITLPPTANTHTSPPWDRLNERYPPLATEASDEEEIYWQVQYGPARVPHTPILRPSPQRVFPSFRREYTHLSDPDLRARFEEWHARNNEQVERNLRDGLVDPLQRQVQNLAADPETSGTGYSPLGSPGYSPTHPRPQANPELIPPLLPTEPTSPTFPLFANQPGFEPLSRQPNYNESVQPLFASESFVHPNLANMPETVRLTSCVHELEAELSRMIIDRSRLRQENLNLNRQNLELQNVAATRRVDNMMLQEEATILARGLADAMNALQAEERMLQETLDQAQTGARSRETRQEDVEQETRQEDVEHGEIAEDQEVAYEEELGREVPRGRGSV